MKQRRCRCRSAPPRARVAIGRARVKAYARRRRPARRNRRRCLMLSSLDDRSRSAGPSRSVPMRSLWREGERWPTGPYMCSRRSTSLTGRPTSRAARDAKDLRSRNQAFRSEAATQEGAANMESSFRRDAEQSRDPSLGPWRGPWLGVSIDRRNRRPTPPRSRGAPWHCGNWVGVS